jgi:hypothetical protein
LVCRQSYSLSPRLWKHHHSLITSGGASRSTNHRIRLLTSAMILHANIQPPGRCESGKRLLFSKALAVFCTGQSGCESAQSHSRTSFRRPWGTASCSRYERLPDTGFGYAASSRAELPTCALPPPWPRLSACCGSGVDTACEISSVEESKIATCCQLGWKSHPTIVMKASPDPVALASTKDYRVR